MADIDIQRKSTPVWPWILGIIIVVAIILFLVAGRDRDQLQNYGGGANDARPIPGQTINPPSPANPDAPNRPDGRNPQVPPATVDQPDNPPAPSESTIDKQTKPEGGANLDLNPNDAHQVVFADQLAQQDQDIPEQELTDPGDQPAGENVIIIEHDQPDDSLILEEEYPPEVTAFSQYLIQNTGTQAELANTYTAEGLRNLGEALYVLSEQNDVDAESREQNRNDISELADQIATDPDDNKQAKATAKGLEQAALWMYEVSETQYPTTENKAQAVQEAADNFDPEGKLSTQLSAVRAFFDRADSVLKDMADS